MNIIIISCLFSLANSLPMWGKGIFEHTLGTDVKTTPHDGLCAFQYEVLKSKLPVEARRAAIKSIRLNKCYKSRSTTRRQYNREQRRLKHKFVSY